MGDTGRQLAEGGEPLGKKKPFLRPLALSYGRKGSLCFAGYAHPCPGRLCSFGASFVPFLPSASLYIVEGKKGGEQR